MKTLMVCPVCGGSMAHNMQQLQQQHEQDHICNEILIYRLRLFGRH